MITEAESRNLFAETTNVSRETMERLDVYAALLRRWNKAINLVAPSTLPNIWTRHFLDSAQIFQFTPEKAKTWGDMGSGAGFPGMVIACLAKEVMPNLEVICIESDKRKAVFLQTLVREIGLNARVLDERVEKAQKSNADIISARALAPINTLLILAERHLKKQGVAVFMKSGGYLHELEEARAHWSFDIRAVPSKTDENGVVLVLGDIRRE